VQHALETVIIVHQCMLTGKHTKAETMISLSEVINAFSVILVSFLRERIPSQSFSSQHINPTQCVLFSASAGLKLGLPGQQ